MDLMMEHRWEEKSSIECLRLVTEMFSQDQIGFACSFGAEDLVILHQLLSVSPDAYVFYLDTGMLFPETMKLIQDLEEIYERPFTRIQPDQRMIKEQERSHPKLWEVNPDRCCQIRKVHPLESVLVNLKAWITGIRREQSLTRAQTEIIEWDSRFSLIKINPLAYWTEKQVWQYIKEYQLLYNPLHDQHYPSIGCAPCTRAIQQGEDGRAGRWSSFSKTECGLHSTK